MEVLTTPRPQLSPPRNRNWPAWIDETNPDTLVPITLTPDDIVVVVAGGDGRHSAWLAGWGVTRVVTQEITTPH